MVDIQIDINGSHVQINEAADLSALKAALKADAQSAVGKHYNDLTTAELKALLGILLFRVGAIDRASVAVRSLDQWLK